jgi:hypothetical protein
MHLDNAIRGQAGADSGQAGSMVREQPLPQGGIAEAEGTIRPVGVEVQGIQAAASLEKCQELAEAMLVGIEHKGIGL